MNFPVSFLDATLWLAYIAIVLIITLEITSNYYGKTSLLINKNHFNLVTKGVFIISIILIIINVLSIN